MARTKKEMCIRDRYKVEAFTGMEIEKINIMVEGVRAID